MGYSTDFSGSLKLSRPATAEEVAYINSFARSRRMRRNIEQLFDIRKGKSGLPFVFKPTPAQARAIKALEKSGLKVSVTAVDTRTPSEIYGNEGEYYTGDDSIGVVDQNRPPSKQPGLWCQWVLSKDGKELEWDGGEKFYEYEAWMQYLIDNFFIPWGIKLKGKITWSGEDSDDLGAIKVVNNKMTAKRATIKY